MARHLKVLGLLFAGGLVGFLVRSIAPTEAPRSLQARAASGLSTHATESSPTRSRHSMLDGILRGRKVRELTVDEVIGLLNQQRQIEGSIDSDPLAATAANLRVHLLARSLDLGQLKPVLDAVHKQVRQGQHFQLGHDFLEYSLLQRFVELDEVGARDWSIQNARKPLYAKILSHTDSDGAVAFMSSENEGEGGWGYASVRVGIRAAEGGVEEFLKVEGLLREGDIRDVLAKLPASRCQEFAELYFGRKQAALGDRDHLDDLMSRWVIVDHSAATSWFWSHPSLENDERLIVGMLSEVLGVDAAAAMAFAEQAFSKNESMARRWFVMMVNSGRNHETWPELCQQLPIGQQPVFSSFYEHYRIGLAPAPEVMLSTAHCLSSAEDQGAYLLRVMRNVGGSSEWWSHCSPDEIAGFLQSVEQLELPENVHDRVMEQFEQLLAEEGDSGD